jgi:hypothetical protein
MLSVQFFINTLSVVMLNAIMLSGVVPYATQASRVESFTVLTTATDWL